VSVGAGSVDSLVMDEPDDDLIVLSPGQRPWEKLLQVAAWMDDLDAPLTAERAFLEHIRSPLRG
jgi:hypothetical protein